MSMNNNNNNKIFKIMLLVFDLVFIVNCVEILICDNGLQKRKEKI